MSAGTPAWRQVREEKRAEASGRRIDAHASRLRSEAAAAGGGRAVAAAEWNILRAAIGRLPEQSREAAWSAVADLLRQRTRDLTSHHAR